MARYKRGFTGGSFLRDPVVVAPVLARPVQTQTVTRPSAYTLARSRLAPPTVVAPVLAPPVAATLARRPQAYQFARSMLSPPTVVAAVVEPVARPLLVHLAPGRPAVRRAYSILFSPVFVGVTPLPAADQRTLAATLASQQPQDTLSRRLAHSRLRPPQVEPPPAFVASPLAVQYQARSQQYTFARSRLLPPTVVGPAAVEPHARPLAVTLTDGRPAVRRAYSLLGAPVSVGATPLPTDDQRTVKQTLARQPQPTPLRSKLRPPVAAEPQAPTAEQQHIRVTLAPHTKLGRRARAFLRPPVAVATPEAPVAQRLRVTLAASSKVPRRAKAGLAGPAIVNLPSLAPELQIRTTFTVPARKMFSIGGFLRPPILAPPTPPTLDQQRIRRELAPSPVQARRAHYLLRPPTVVKIVLPREQQEIRATLAPQPLQGRRTRWLLRPPTVTNVPAVATDALRLSVTLAPSHTRSRKATIGLGLPAVVRPSLGDPCLLEFTVATADGLTFVADTADGLTFTTAGAVGLTFSAGSPAGLTFPPADDDDLVFTEPPC